MVRLKCIAAFPLRLIRISRKRETVWSESRTFLSPDAYGILFSPDNPLSWAFSLFFFLLFSFPFPSEKRPVEPAESVLSRNPFFTFLEACGLLLGPILGCLESFFISLQDALEAFLARSMALEELEYSFSFPLFQMGSFLGCVGIEAFSQTQFYRSRRNVTQGFSLKNSLTTPAKVQCGEYFPFGRGTYGKGRRRNCVYPTAMVAQRWPPLLGRPARNHPMLCIGATNKIFRGSGFVYNYLYTLTWVAMSSSALKRSSRLLPGLPAG